MGNRHEDDLHPCGWRQPAGRTSQSLAQTPNHSVRYTVQRRRQITVLETLHGVRDTSLLRPVRSRYVRPESLLTASEPQAIRDCTPTSQRLDPSTVSRRHLTMSATSLVRRHPTMSETSNLIRIWPSGSRLARSCLAVCWSLFVCGQWLSPVWCFCRPCRSFGGFSPRPFPRFGAFLVLRVCCPGPVFSVGSEPGRFVGLNKFSPSWTKMV